LSITHNQWIYRNTQLHLRLVEGKTLAEHDAVMEEVLRLLATEPDDMRPQHRSLLTLDMEKLGSGSTADRQYWVANMSSALLAARSANTGNATFAVSGSEPPDVMQYNIPTTGHT
jgi:hypothetical protein